MDETNLKELVGTLQLTQQVRGGMEAAKTATFRVDEDGFHEAGGPGGPGQDPRVLPAEEVAAALREQFPDARMRRILGYFRELYDALAP